MIESITAAIGGLQTASDIAKSFVNLRDIALLQAKTIELQTAILAAQTSALAAHSEQLALVQRVRDAEEKVARMEAWSAEKQRYKLHEPKPGVFTYILKEEEQAAEPSHQICATCYDTHKRKSILQLEHIRVGRGQHLLCHACGSEVIIVGVRQDGR